jgi:hypothetical protein
MLEQATEAWLTAGSGGGGKKGAQLAVDASGRMVIGMSGRRMAHRMPAAIEVAIETLEGSLLVMRRANKPTVARCARRFQPLRSILTEIYLCRTCSCHEILRVETPGQGGRASHPSAGGAGAQRPEGEGEGAVHARCIDRSMRPRCDDRSGAGAVHALSPRHHRRHCRRRQRRGRGGAADACVRACVRVRLWCFFRAGAGGAERRARGVVAGPPHDGAHQPRPDRVVHRYPQPRDPARAAAQGGVGRPRGATPRAGGGRPPQDRAGE